MTYLLDTSPLLWYLSEDAKLPVGIQADIEAGSSSFYLSVASLWKIAIKISIGKLDSPLTLDDFAYEALVVEKFALLDIKIPHLARYAELPLHHRDPFDRLLIAQSMVEGIPVITSDAAFDRYAIQRVW